MITIIYPESIHDSKLGIRAWSRFFFVYFMINSTFTSTLHFVGSVEWLMKESADFVLACYGNLITY